MEGGTKGRRKEEEGIKGGWSVFEICIVETLAKSPSGTRSQRTVSESALHSPFPEDGPLHIATLDPS